MLIVCGDDFGLTDGICEGILHAHEHGILTSTSAIATGPAFGRWATPLRDSGLDIGVHLCAVGEDPPLLSPGEIPTLVDRHGRLAVDWRTFIRRAAAGRVDRDDLHREFEAQLEAVTGSELRVTHLNTHQHLHLWPAVAAVLVDIATSARIRAIRVTQAHERSMRTAGIRPLERSLRRRARRAGLLTPGAFVGLDEAGSMGDASMRSAIDRLAADGAATAELGCHPGAAVDPDRQRYRWGYRWVDELDALTDPSIGRHVEEVGFRLGSFADLATTVGGR